MKLQLEVSCKEQDLLGAIVEAQAIVKAMSITSLAVEVRSNTTNKLIKWVTVTQYNHPADLVKIYQLEKSLETALQPTVVPVAKPE